MKIFFLLCVSTGFLSFCQGQENYEIQVYGSQTQQKNSTICELHSNFTLNGEEETVQGVRPTDHALHETVEITHGITRDFEIGAYLFTNYIPSFGYQVVGTHIRPRIMAPQKWLWPVGVSLSTEIGYQRAEYAGETWSIEVRPIVDKQWSRFYVSFNPTFGIALKSEANNSIPVFEPNVKASYSVVRNWSCGVEYYGGMGPVNAFEPWAAQDHAVFMVFDLLNSTYWELNGGFGFGLTPATDGLVAKLIIGRRIFWKNITTTQ